MLRQNKHRQVMYNILKDIFESRYSNMIAFKWWTLCYFIYGLNRFSTDLDFDIVLDAWNDDFVLQIKQILNKYWNVKERKSDKKFTYFFILSYWEDNTNIKLEFNKRIWKSNKYEKINFYWTDIKVMDKSSIFANKLVALTDREKLANRDIFDIYFFFKNNFPINEGVIKERTQKDLKQYLEHVLGFIKKINNKWILNWLWELINDKQKAFVKNKLLNDLIWLIKFNSE